MYKDYNISLGAVMPNFYLAIERIAFNVNIYRFNLGKKMRNWIRNRQKTLTVNLAKSEFL